MLSCRGTKRLSATRDGNEPCMHTVAVCGTGYVGIVTAACLAYIGNDVAAYDTDLTKIAMLRRGDLPLHEPNLATLMRAAVANGRLRFTTSPRDALADREIVFIAVGTPVGPLGDADLTYVRQAARDIARYADGDLLVVNKSTVPVETADLVARLLEREANGRRFTVASNPEFLREGTAVDDFMRPDRIVIGTEDERAATLLRDLYRSFDAPVLVVDPHTAEMIKYAANAFLAAKISFVNELSSLCDAVGANIDDVLKGISYDHRIGRQHMQPGIGFGGSCLPKDVSALSHVARSHDIEPTMLDAVLDVNRRQVARAVRRVAGECGELDGQTAAVWGLSFKPETDDIRESPAIALVHALLSQGTSVRVHDPAAAANARSVLRDRVTFAKDAYDALEGADFLIVATPWASYRTADWRRVRSLLRTPVVFDMRNGLDADMLLSMDFRYVGIARHGNTRIAQ